MSALNHMQKRLRIISSVLIILFFIQTSYIYIPYHNNREPEPLEPISYTHKESPSHSKLDLAKVAVIIDTRIQPRLFPLLLHFSAILGPSWPIRIYTSGAGAQSLLASASINSSRSITPFILPEDINFPSTDEYSNFMTSRWIWDQLAPAEHVLIFQADSILCTRAPKRVDDFLEWDFIGAPIAEKYGNGYNGGLSLRKRSSTLRVIDNFEWTRPDFEDQWYYARLLELQEQDGIARNESTIKLPPKHIAMTFAVETVDFHSPVGLHQPRRFPLQEEVSIDDFCPEYVLCLKYGDR